ncbi:MAG: hypothetical protein MZV63_56025 [Marinilabiliales bacterium]|nr:hypothetical protein [Marinilabiliales bacterium]
MLEAVSPAGSCHRWWVFRGKHPSRNILHPSVGTICQVVRGKWKGSGVRYGL